MRWVMMAGGILLFSRKRREPDSKDLTSLANYYGSDKGTKAGNAHDYTRLYSFLFEHLRQRKFDMLEIGLLRPHADPQMRTVRGRFASEAPSVCMWLDYFPNAHCHGIDISDFSSVSMDRFIFHQADLSDAPSIRALASRLPSLEIVIDDASHASFHQQVAFASFFPKVDSRGFYVIEDLEWQPEFESSMPCTAKTADVFTAFLAGDALRIETATDDENAAMASEIGRIFIDRDRDRSGACGAIKMIVIEKKRDGRD
jgi:hypothetical protein